MNLYHIPTDTEAPLNPNAVQPYKGMSWDRPADRARFVEAGYRAIEFPNPPPQDVIVTGTTYTPKDEETVTKSQTWETQEEAEAKRIANLAQEYGQQVGRLAQLLAEFGLAMPITADETIAPVSQAILADPRKSAPSQEMMLIYGRLNAVLSDEDIYAVSKVIGVAE